MNTVISHSNPIVCGDSVISSVIRSQPTTEQAGALCRPSVKTLLPELTVKQGAGGGRPPIPIATKSPLP